jgi:predicted Zn-dependent peptidase
MKNFKKIVLKNGLRLILVPQSQALATTVSVSVEAGSKYETRELNGLSHFLEHMCFKGTKNRPSHVDIANELDGLGAQYNAFTGQEWTSYYAKAKNEAFDNVLDIVSDLYLNPVFVPEEIEKEKGVIIGEMNMYDDMPNRRVSDLFMELLYGDQPAGWPVDGRKEVINGIKREDFINYRAKHYLPQATLVVVAGGFAGSEAEIIGKVENCFATHATGHKGMKPKVLEAQKKPAELVKFKETDQTHLIMGFRAFGIFDERRYPLDVLADILGGGMGSRLFQKVREDLGAAYYVNASADLYSDHGVIAMAAGVHHEKLEEVLKASLGEFRRFVDEKVDEKTLRRAKDHLIGNLFLSLETSDQLGYFYAGQDIMGLDLKKPQEVADRVEKVTADDIRKVAGELFVDNSLNLALIGPFKDKNFSDILKT